MTEERSVRVRIRRAVVGMVQEVVRIEAELEADTLGDAEILPDTHVAAEESGTAESIAAHGTGEVRAGDRGSEASWAGIGEGRDAGRRV